MLLERGTLRDAEAWAKNVVSRVSNHIFEVAHNTLSITCTIGLAEVAPGTDRTEALVSGAQTRRSAGPRRAAATAWCSRRPRTQSTRASNVSTRFGFSRSSWR